MRVPPRPGNKYGKPNDTPQIIINPANPRLGMFDTKAAMHAEPIELSRADVTNTSGTKKANAATIFV